MTTSIARALIAPLLALLLALTPVIAGAGIEDMTADERAAFRAEVRAYLLENPEVLMEALTALRQRQESAEAARRRDVIAENAGAIHEDPRAWVGGNPDGDITLVEFMDYRCSYCRRAFPEVSHLIESDGDIRFVVKEFPVLGPESQAAARFAIATLQVAGAKAYEKVHDALMTHRGRMAPAAFRRIAGSAGLEYAAIAERMDAPGVQAVIDDNMALARRLGITGTPTFIIEDRMIPGYLPLERMRRAVAEERAD